jgi:tyrosyl-tRNA synthetase
MQIKQILTRGVEQVLPGADSLLEHILEKEKQGQRIRVYLGIDPTGSDLTLGHAVVLRKLQQFADAGHEVILLIGNGTVKIGDPTGKDTTRPELTDEQIEENFKNWKEQASKVLDFSKITIKHNGDWLDKLSMPEVIKLMAKVTVQQLMERDMFQKRVEENKPIHGHEIMYPMLQGYDSVAMDVDLEIGGSDQLFNMMMGRTLQKIYHNKEKWVLTTPIINGTDGRKMSKSYGNYIALTEDHLNMYGQLMSVADEEIINYFKALTNISDEEISQMEQAIANGENPMTFKKKLALEITTWLHTSELAAKAQAHFEKTVQNKEVPNDLPQIKVEASEINIWELCKKANLPQSNSQIRRVIEQGGVKLNGEKITDPQQEIKLSSGDTLQIGKRNFFEIIL